MPDVCKSNAQDLDPQNVRSARELQRKTQKAPIRRYGQSSQDNHHVTTCPEFLPMQSIFASF